MTTFTNEQKLKCAARELAMRKRVYSRFVERGSMTADEAQHEIAVMEDIVRDYQQLVDKQGKLGL